MLLIFFDRSFGHTKPLRSYIFHFVPFVILFFLKVPFYLSPPDKKLYHILDIQFAGAFKHYEWIKLTLLFVYGVLIFLKINNQSGVGSMKLWAKSVLGFFWAYIVLALVYKLIADNGMYTPQIDYVIALLSCLSIGFIAWYGIGFSEIADGQSIAASLFQISRPTIRIEDQLNEPISQQTLEKYKNSGLPISFALKLAEQLETLMKTEKLFSENDLSLSKLAEKLGTNKHFVSQVINQQFQMNFFDYVNSKRIEEAKHLLRNRSKDDLNIIEVAYIVGFNNKGTFNAVFKKFTGTTPSEFRAHPN